jgi:hypothetical protein
MRRAVLLWLVALVAACGDQLAARQAYLARFVGQPESAVVQQMGVPTRSFETGGIRYLAYNQRRIELIPAFPTYGAFYPAWYGGGFPPQVVELQCETTFEVAEGTVRAFTLRGNACGDLQFGSGLVSQPVDQVSPPQAGK